MSTLSVASEGDRCLCSATPWFARRGPQACGQAPQERLPLPTSPLPTLGLETGMGAGLRDRGLQCVAGLLAGRWCGAVAMFGSLPRMFHVKHAAGNLGWLGWSRIAGKGREAHAKCLGRAAVAIGAAPDRVHAPRSTVSAPLKSVRLTVSTPRGPLFPRPEVGTPPARQGGTEAAQPLGRQCFT